MKEAHKGMKITNAQFDAAAQYLKEALESNKVKPEDVSAVLKAVEATRKDIVEEDGAPPPPKEEPKPQPKPKLNLTIPSNITGVVTRNGKPLANAKISFVPKSGKGKVQSTTTDVSRQL
ncbi:MAG: hypothetical protein KatS3mg105_0128 [Gemmatales bacterium]|nr:MAG: hypothetical protein KatS3mg105_0128 [Gemmatales bacterium]